MRCFGVAFISSLVALAFAPEIARACSGAPCARTVGLVLPQSGVVPANLGELTTHDPAWGFPTEAELRVWGASDPTTVLFRGNTRELRAIPIGPLSVGERYVAEVTPSCEWTAEDDKLPQRFMFQAGPASEPPSSLGPLVLVRNGDATVPWGGGSSCWQDFKAAAGELRLDAAALPEAWRELLTDYQLMVDGEPFSWILTTGGYWPDAPRGFYRANPAAFQVWTACGPLPTDSVNHTPVPSQATPGKHTVWVRARLPSTEPKFLESERVELELSCNDPPPLPPQSPPGLAAVDAGQGASVAGDEGSASEYADDADCSVSHAADQAHGSGAVVGLIAMLGAFRRRLRRDSSN